ncbi:hypothetical protein BHM03_00027815 [Ensete ventricosum]|nr:hypothetical protein BHM03_00027815 [Ensete ventricosum]
MKAGHDLDTVVIEGSLVAIRERYNIPREYGLHISWPGQHPYSSDVPGVCISVDALEIGLHHRGVPQVVGNLPESGGTQLVALPRSIFGRMSRGWEYPDPELVHDILSPLQESRWLLPYRPCQFSRPNGSRRSVRDAEGVWGELPTTRAAAPAREVGDTPSTEAPRSSFKRSSDASVQQSDDLARRHKKVKILSRRHKFRRDEGGSRSHSRGKESAMSVEELETPVESAKEIVTSVFHRPKSLKDLCGTKARWEKLKNSTKIWNDPMATEEFKRGLLHPQLARELYTLPSEVLLA